MAVVQSNAAAAAATSTTATVVLPSAPTPGNLLVAYVTGSTTSSTVNMSGWTLGTIISGGSGGTGRHARMAWKTVVAGDSATVSATVISSYWAIAVVEYSEFPSHTALAQNQQLNASGVYTTPALAPTAGKVATMTFAIGVRVVTTFSNQAVTGGGTVTELHDISATNVNTLALYTTDIASTTGTYTGSATPATAAVGVGLGGIWERTASNPPTVTAKAPPVGAQIM